MKKKESRAFDAGFNAGWDAAMKFTEETDNAV